MERADLILLRDLLRNQRLLSLAVIVDGAPVAGLVPFLATPDLASLTVHVSGLARHTHGLGEGAPWSGVVHVPDSESLDPLQIPRTSLRGASHRIEDAAVLAPIRSQWVRRFPAAAMTIDLGDFVFVTLELHAGRLVGGLGQARNLSREHFARAAAVDL